MGLTIHYELKAKGSARLAGKLVHQLHQTAHDLPFKEVGSIVDLSGSECEFGRRGKDDPLRWLLIQTERSIKVKNTHQVSGERGDTWVSVPPSRIIAFTAWPGEGCEESNFGLCQYPTTVFSPNFGTLKTKLPGWSWKSFCKTQYASDPRVGGAQNFLRCHLTVVALLDKARELGCLGEVRDEGKFWENRNVEQLTKEIGSWNQFIAALGGMVKDTVGDGVKMPIADYPNFELLELAGQNQLPPQTQQLVRLIKQVSQKS